MTRKTGLHQRGAVGVSEKSRLILAVDTSHVSNAKAGAHLGGADNRPGTTFDSGYCLISLFTMPIHQHHALHYYCTVLAVFDVSLLPCAVLLTVAQFCYRARSDLCHLAYSCSSGPKSRRCVATDIELHVKHNAQALSAFGSCSGKFCMFYYWHQTLRYRRCPLRNSTNKVF